MMAERACNLPNGLYLFRWRRDGTESEVAVHRDKAGAAWFTPTDWSGPSQDWDAVLSFRTFRTKEPELSERKQALKLAFRLITERQYPTVESEALQLLARQLVKGQEYIDNLKAELTYDPTSDLIHSNRDALLQKYQEAIWLIRNQICQVNTSDARPGYEQTKAIAKVLDALSLFHPMHAESWKGWPQ